MGPAKVVDLPPPKYDTNGRVIPIWDALEADIRKEEKNSMTKLYSWKSWISKSTSWVTMGQEPSKKNTLWKPATLRFPVLASIFTVTVAMIIGLEILSYLSHGKNNYNGGGLAFGETVDDISTIATVSYLYLPTVIAVVYSMIWSWIDLDSKRLEPWFQLSKPGGATAQDSILLHYPFDFLPFVPIRAVRRRHWAIFITGTTMMLVTWAIVPLQSAIFSTGTVTRTRETRMVTTAGFLPLEAQTTTLNSQFLNTAYGVSWLDQKLPPYTTREFALQPFSPIAGDTTSSDSDTWSSSTLAYYTNLTCTPAIVKPGLVKADYIFDDGNGCVTADISFPAYSPTAAQFLVMYIPFYNDPHIDWALGNPNCTTEHSHNFLAIWAKPQYIDNAPSYHKVYSNITAQFCRPTYHFRRVDATVNATSRAVISIGYNNAADMPLPETDFNITNFEYIIGTGVPEEQIYSPSAGDFPDVSIVEQWPRLINYSLAWPVENMVGFGMAASSGSAKDLASPSQLHAAFESAHKLLFSVAVSALMTAEGHTTVENPGFLTDQPASIIFVRSFSIIVEAFLAIVGILICILWIIYQQRQSNMTHDPASISDIMGLICGGEEPLCGFNDSDILTTKQLKERLHDHRYRLIATYRGGSSKMRLETLEVEGKYGCKPSGFRSNIDCPEQFQAVRPLELRFITGGMIGSIIVVAIVILSFIYRRILQDNGLTRPSNDPLVLSILENLVPTAFATLNEPFWVVLNRLLCILQPFADLHNGKAKSNTTLEAKYTSTPPQLAIWRAVRSGHFLLAMVCIVAISTNILAVSLSGLFNESVRSLTIPAKSKSIYTPMLNGTHAIKKTMVTITTVQYFDHFYATLANLSGSAPLPPWVDENFFYLPFDNITSEQSLANELRIEGYSTSTRGFGIDLSCEQIFTDRGDDRLVFLPSQNGSSLEFAMTHKLSGGRNVTCSSSIGIVPEGKWANDACAFELISPMELLNITGDSFPDDDYCKSTIVAGWARIEPAGTVIAPASTNDIATDGRLLETAFMRCVPTLRTAIFNITVDTTKRIISSTRTSEFDTNIEAFVTEHSHASVMRQISELLIPGTGRNVRWHNDTFAMDWVNSLLKIKQNSTALLNAAAPIPDISTVIPDFTDILRRLSALIFSFDTELFLKSTAVNTMPVLVIAKESRIFMSPTMLYIALSILSFQLLTLLAYYVKRPRRFLPRMPLTIASIIASVSASHAVHDYSGQTNANPSATRYGYGRFKGTDGKTHVGIEKEPLVVPLKSKNPEIKRRKWPFRRSSDPKEPQIWI